MKELMTKLKKIFWFRYKLTKRLIPKLTKKIITGLRLSDKNVPFVNTL